jgi:hypothetical protein
MAPPVLYQLVINVYGDADPALVEALLVVVCPSCSLRMGDCRCPDYGYEIRRGHSRGVWAYHSRVEWRIGLRSLLDLDVTRLDHVNASSRTRLLAFIEYLHAR